MRPYFCYYMVMIKTAKIQGFKVNLLSFEEALEYSLNSIKNNRNVHIVTINPEIIQNAKNKPELKNIINNAELVTADGIGIKIALKFKGINQQKITGVDFSEKMLQIAADNGIKTAFVGAKKDVLELAVKNSLEKYKNLNIVYSHDGYFSDFNPIIDDIINSGAKFILCAMGSPKQEYFISELKKRVEGALMIGVGGTFDVLSGTVKLAPPLFRKLGLEWLYRTIKQPERIKRIFPALPIFFFQSIIDSVNDKSAR